LCVCSNEIRQGILRRSYEKKGQRQGNVRGRGVSTTCQKEEDERMSAVKTQQRMLIFSDIDCGSIEGKHNFEFKGELHTDNQNSIVYLTLAYLTTVYQMHQLHVDL
jgi:hypothetical protein